MIQSINQHRQLAEAEAAKLLAALPAEMRVIVERLPFGARWALAASVNELRTKGNRDMYIRGIAIGQVSAAMERNEISHDQFETLALYIGNLPE
ncbi:hypothetical protein PspCFBP13506_11685 [Pseudomonas sp. CFBP13506]|uniref:hypothetical protein n=1 Tax=Pseudomonas sp. CFBP13506 TaxID=2184010 RepID=UPI0010C12468|nr:hypothetical protein [Pseudomonas sp. CFBP13506]TKJ63036.1 hypothetical protein PspCFBP13506_11685 [Pseudomonas sp. CFBP13506]